MTRETRGRGEILGEGGAVWEMAATSLHNDVFSVIPKHVTSERPIALLPTVIRGWEALRDPEVATWQREYRFEWDATGWRCGGAERTVWETFLEMGTFNSHAGERDQEAVAVVLDLAKAFAGLSSGCVGLGGAFQFSQEDLAIVMRVLRLQTITAVLPDSTWSCLLLRIVLQDAWSEVTQILSASEIEVFFVDDVTAFLNWRNKELVEMAEKVLNKLKREIEAKGFKLSITEGEKEGKSKAITSCTFLEERFQECSKTDGFVLETSVETQGVDLRTRTRHLGAKEKARRKKFDVRFSLRRKNSGVPRNFIWSLV